VAGIFEVRSPTAKGIGRSVRSQRSTINLKWVVKARRWKRYLGDVRDKRNERDERNMFFL